MLKQEGIGTEVLYQINYPGSTIVYNVYEDVYIGGLPHMKSFIFITTADKFGSSAFRAFVAGINKLARRFGIEVHPDEGEEGYGEWVSKTHSEHLIKQGWEKV